MDERKGEESPRPDPDDVVGAGKSLQHSAIFTMFTGAAAAFGGGRLAAHTPGPRLSTKVQSMPWWVQLAFGLVLWQPIVTVPLFYLVTGSWTQAAIISALLWVGCTLVGSLLISVFAIRPHESPPEQPVDSDPVESDPVNRDDAGA